MKVSDDIKCVDDTTLEKFNVDAIAIDDDKYFYNKNIRCYDAKNTRHYNESHCAIFDSNHSILKISYTLTAATIDGITTNEFNEKGNFIQNTTL